MDKLPIIWAGKAVGELTAVHQGLYTRLEVSCRLPDEGLWCVWVCGDGGEFRVGVPEPAGEHSVIVRSFSDHSMQEVGAIRRAVLRPVAEGSKLSWQAVNRPEEWFSTPWLCQQLRNVPGVLAAREGERRHLAVPYRRDRPFPLIRLFCFIRICRMEEDAYAVCTFDRRELPVL